MPRLIKRASQRPVKANWRVIIPLYLLPLSLLLVLLTLLSLLSILPERADPREELASAWQALQSQVLESTGQVANGRIGNKPDIARLRDFDQLVLDATQSDATRITKLVRRAVFFSLTSMFLFIWLLYERQIQRRQQLRLDGGHANREQDAILTLMGEMAPLASGDLRVRASVSEAMTGALADGFNYAVSELRWLVATVSDSARQVSSSVEQSRVTAKTLASACNVQAREIHRSSNYLNAMSDTMAQLSAHAAESSRMATVSFSEAQVASVLIEKNVEGLLRIRDEASMTTRLMHRLANNAAAIDTQVAAIMDVAARTDLLALNTTIRAAADVQGGGDLSRLSDDVGLLADRLGTVARDIASLTRIIQQDAKDTVQAMEQTNSELAGGLELAEQTRTSLASIDAVSRELKMLVGDMAEKTVLQSGVVRRLSSNMSVINTITQDNASGARNAAAGLDELQELAEELKNGVADFRLPSKPMAGQRIELNADVVPGGLQESRQAVAHD
ncbi:MAG: methyl-accepting chemotaxis protein [Granulosicoccus sp.]